MHVRLRRNLLAGLWLFGGLAIARAEPPVPAAAPDTPESPAIARFEGGAVTRAEMEAAIAVKAPVIRARIATPEGRREFLEELVEWDLLSVEAERRGYARHGLVEDAAAQAAIDAMTAAELTPDPQSIPREEVEARYEAQRARYHVPALRHASHIEVGTEAEARALAGRLAGVDRVAFAQAALRHSRNPRTRKQGGELGWFTRDATGATGEPVGVPAEIAAVAFAAAEMNTVLPNPVRHGDAYSVVMIHGQRPELTRPLERVERQIRAELASEHAEAAVAALVAKLAAERKPVVVNPGLLSLVALDTSLPDQPTGFPAAPPDPRAPTKMTEEEDEGF